MRSAIILLVLSGMVSAHEVMLVGQHVKINAQGKTGWQQDAIGRAVINDKNQIGLQGTYLERFDHYEHRVGGFYTYRPSDAWTLEVKWLHGTDEVQILPLDQYYVAAYYGWIPGIAPFMFYRKSIYSVTHVDDVVFGLEIEKIQNIIFIPQISKGTARFNDPHDTEDLHNFGLRTVYYIESQYSFFAFGYKGREASQGVVGRSSIVVDTLTAGGGGSYHFTQRFKSELTLDYTDYDQLKNQFLTTTLNLKWTF
jgi:hypothetical protein